MFFSIHTQFSERIKGRKPIKPIYPVLPKLQREGAEKRRRQNDLSETEEGSDYEYEHTESVESSSLHISKSFNDSSYRADKNTSEDTPPQKEKSESNTTIIVAGAIIMICVAIFLRIYFGNASEIAKSNGPIQCLQFKELENDFPHQDMLLWKSLRIGIQNVLNLNPTRPSVFLLAYSDINTSNHIMSKILNATKSCMKSQNPIELDGGTFATDAMIKDYGEIIQKYKGDLENEGVMFVSDVQRTPARAAQVFHTICDTITPLVERAVIFFTVHLDRHDTKMTHNMLSEIVEDQLENSWKKDGSVESDTLKALIGRMTEQVFLLNTENF